MIPPLLIAISVLLSLISNSYFPIIRLIPPPLNLAGLFVIVISLSFMLFGYFQFLKQHTTLIYGQRPRHLITSGIFSHTRNPLYLSLVLMDIGLAIFLGNLSAFIGPLVLILSLNKFVIPNEEKTLDKLFGEKYGNYKKSVSRWI
jgi:protein-S-isoprenylcysteine O-methyltransferase Ste14